MFLNKYFFFIFLCAFFMPLVGMKELCDKINSNASAEEIEDFLKAQKLPSRFATAALPALADGPSVDHKIIDVLIKFADSRDLRDLVSDSPTRASCRRSAYVQQQIEKKISERFPEPIMTTSFAPVTISQEPFEIDQGRLDSIEKLMQKKKQERLDRAEKPRQKNKTASNRTIKNSFFSYAKWLGLCMSLAYVVYYLSVPKVSQRVVKSA